MMRRGTLLAVLFILIGMSGYAKENSNTAVLFEGTSLRGSWHPFSDNSGLGGMKSSRSVFTGVEVRFNQNGRVTIGADYQNWSLSSPSKTNFVEFANGLIHHPQTGKPLASVTESRWAKANLVSSTAYINILKEGKIRPFVAFGGGVALIEQTISTISFVHPHIEEVIGYTFKFEKPESRTSENRAKPTIKAVAGLNVFPVAHTIVSFSGGYHNGAVLNFAFGFVF